MTRLLEEGIQAVRDLPADAQDRAGQLLLAVAERDRSGYRLTPQQAEDVQLAIAEADRGEFATDDDMAVFWRKCGL